MTTEQLCLTAAILFFCVALWMFLRQEYWRKEAEYWEGSSDNWRKLCEESGDGFKRAVQSVKEANASTQRALDTANEWRRMYFEEKGLDLPLGAATEENPNYSKN